MVSSVSVLLLARVEDISTVVETVDSGTKSESELEDEDELAKASEAVEKERS